MYPHLILKKKGVLEVFCLSAVGCGAVELHFGIVIADVTVWKHDQRLDENLIIFTHRKIVSQETLSVRQTFITRECCMKHVNWTASSVKGIYRNGIIEIFEIKFADFVDEV